MFTTINNKSIILLNFWVIGAGRLVTSWLDRLLFSRPDIYLPESHKEVDFFNRYYDRGVDKKYSRSSCVLNPKT